jgi:uncharacterized membrane protein
MGIVRDINKDKRNKRMQNSRRLRNAGLFSVFSGIICLLISCIHYVFLNSPLVNSNDSTIWHRIFGIWMPVAGAVLLVIGIILLSKFTIDDTIN